MTSEDKFWYVWRDPYLLNTIFEFNRGRNGDMAAAIGYLHGIVYGTNLEFTTHAMDVAATGGHLHVVKWLHKNREEGCTTNAMDWGATNGHLHVVKWLHKNREEGCTTIAMDYAASRGRLHVVKWLHENREEGCTKWAMTGSARKGHLHMVQWLLRHRGDGGADMAMIHAAGNGHLLVVKWLFEHLEYTPLTKNTFKDTIIEARDHARFWDHSDVVEWLEAQLIFFFE